jgi:hypothetical protein
MATYSSSSMYGGGTPGEALSGAKTFTISQFTGSNGGFLIGYLTLEGNSTANRNLSSQQNLSGTFGSFTKMDDDSLNTSSDFRWSISIPPTESCSFTFTPGAAVSANTYYIKATGNFNLTIS